MSTSKEGWLRTSRYLKTRRPAPRVLLIAISNPPYNLRVKSINLHLYLSNPSYFPYSASTVTFFTI